LASDQGLSLHGKFRACAERRLGYSGRQMSIFLAIIIYWIMAAILIAGVIMAVKGTFWLLILGFIGFVFAVTKVAILPHSH
jgi:hypothetical protein